MPVVTGAATVLLPCWREHNTTPHRHGRAPTGFSKTTWSSVRLTPSRRATVDSIVPLAIRQRLAVDAAIAPVRAGMRPRRPRGVKPNCWCCADGEDQQSHDQKLDHRGLRLMRRFRPRTGG